jgi:hypothetical protein
LLAFGTGGVALQLRAVAFARNCLLSLAERVVDAR